MSLSDLRVAPRSVQQATVETLRAAIAAGRFKPGDRLVEADLCEMLGVSRPSVREALRSLEAERLVSLIPNRGPQIPVLSRECAAEIYRVRALLEGEAAALCAAKAEATDTAAMRSALAAFGKAVRGRDSDGQVAATDAFYAIILRACGNGVIEEMLQGLRARINFLRARSMSMPGRAPVSHEEMTAILDAVQRRDPAAARAAAERHVENAHRSALAAYDADAGEPATSDAT